MEAIFVAFGVPFTICVLLPVMCVWLTMRRSINNDNKRAEVIIKAIEANNNIDADKLAEALSKPRLTPREQLNNRLLRGCIWSFIGMALVAGGYLTFVNDNNLTFGDDDVFFPFVGGACSFAVGISYLIVYFVTRKQVESPDDAE